MKHLLLALSAATCITAACQPDETFGTQESFVKCSNDGNASCDATMPPLDEWNGESLPNPVTKRATLVILTPSQGKTTHEVVVIDEKVERFLKVRSKDIEEFLKKNSDYMELRPRKDMEPSRDGGAKGFTADVAAAGKDEPAGCKASKNPAACFIALADALSTVQSLAVDVGNSCDR